MRRSRAFLVALMTLCFGAETRADTRVALVIGNSMYLSVDALPNPKKDAALVADTLKREGFDVTLVQDATRDTMLATLNDFNEQADKADWALVYYAGHGIEVGGVNYLLPTDIWFRTDRDVEDEAVSLPRVLGTVAAARKLRLVILDACRDNIFATPVRRMTAPRSVGRGLAPVEPQSGVLVVYAAEAGATAEDGKGDHSPFTTALVQRLQQPGLEVNRLFNLVTADVMNSTARRQRPFQYGSNPSEDEFFFMPPLPMQAPPTREEQIWSWLKTLNDVPGITAFRDGLAIASPLRAEVDAVLSKLNAKRVSAPLSDRVPRTKPDAGDVNAVASKVEGAPNKTEVGPAEVATIFHAGPSMQPMALAQRAALLVNAPDEPLRVHTYVGSVVWHFDSISPGGGRPLAGAVKADIDIPDAKLKVTMLIQRNTEAKIPATHMIEFHFLPQESNTLGPVKQVNVPEMRKNDDAQTGNALAGVPVAITDNYFLIGLTRGAAESQNGHLIVERNWFDMSVLFASGKLGKLTFEKGAAAPSISRILKADPSLAFANPTGVGVAAVSQSDHLSPDDVTAPNADTVAAKTDLSTNPSSSSFPESKKVKTFVVHPGVNRN